MVDHEILETESQSPNSSFPFWIWCFGFGAWTLYGTWPRLVKCQKIFLIFFCVQNLLWVRLCGCPWLQGQGQVQDGEHADWPVHAADHLRAKGELNKSKNTLNGSFSERKESSGDSQRVLTSSRTSSLIRKKSGRIFIMERIPWLIVYWENPIVSIRFSL